MRLAYLSCLLPVLGVSVIAFGQTKIPSPSQPQSAQVVKSYKQLACLTPAEFTVNPELEMLCRLKTPGDLAKAEKRHGPHALCGIMVYASSSVAKGLAAKTKAFPVGTVLVKEKHVHPVYDGMTESKTRRNGVGGMIKRAPGYDPAHGDWEYFFQEENGKLETGKIASCISCHEHASGPDHVFATWYKNKPTR